MAVIGKIDSFPCIIWNYLISRLDDLLDHLYIILICIIIKKTLFIKVSIFTLKCFRKNTIQTVILWNNTILNNGFLFIYFKMQFEYVFNSCNGKAEFSPVFNVT